MKLVAVIALLVALCGNAAWADLHLTGCQYPGPVNDVFEIYALNDGMHGTGTLILSEHVALLDAIGPSAAGGSGFIFRR